MKELPLAQYPFLSYDEYLNELTPVLENQDYTIGIPQTTLARQLKQRNYPMLNAEKRDEIIQGIIQRSGGMMKVVKKQPEEFSTLAGLPLIVARIVEDDDNLTFSQFEDMDCEKLLSIYDSFLFKAHDAELLFSTVHESLCGIVADFITNFGWEDGVKVLQKTLNIMGKRDNMMAMLEMDGRFGPRTAKAWKWYVSVKNDPETGRPDYKPLSWFRKIFLDQSFYHILNLAIDEPSMVKELPGYYNRIINLRRVR